MCSLYFWEEFTGLLLVAGGSVLVRVIHATHSSKRTVDLFWASLENKAQTHSDVELEILKQKKERRGTQRYKTALSRTVLRIPTILCFSALIKLFMVNQSIKTQPLLHLCCNVTHIFIFVSNFSNFRRIDKLLCMLSSE